MEIQFPPGVVKSDSLAASVGRYVEAEHVRWVGGHAEKIGGWKKLFPDRSNGTVVALKGIPRSAHVYRAPSGLEVFAWGTDIHLYVSDPRDPPNDLPINITPYRRSIVVTDPFSVVVDVEKIVVHDENHGAKQGDSVYFSRNPGGGNVIFAGITLDHTEGYLVTSVLNNDAYTINAGQPANVTTALGVPIGGVVNLNYEVNVGTTDSVERKGYGGGPYGDDLYGTERNLVGAELTPRYWSLDNYGTKLLASFQGGTIYWWDQDTDPRAEAIITDNDTALPLPPGPRTPVPTDMIYVFVTEERFIFALREDMNVSWPDQDNPTNWTPGLTSKANTRRLAKGNKLICGASLGGGVSLVWSDTSLYAFQFTGGQFVYSSRLAGTNCGIVGPGAFCVAEGATFWAGTNGFHIFNGSVQGIPNSDDIHAWFYGNMTLGHRRKTTCWYNAEAREVWFSAPLGNTDPDHSKARPAGSEYDSEPPSKGATEPTNYVYVNIDNWHWGAGALGRTCASFSVTKGIMLGTARGIIYQHEIGNDSDEDPLKTVLKSGLYRIPEAQTNIDIFGFSPDFEWQVGDIQGRVFALDRPMNLEHADNTQIFTLTPTTGIKDIRVRGRYIGFELIQNVMGGQWRMGIPVAEIQQAGTRR